MWRQGTSVCLTSTFIAMIASGCGCGWRMRMRAPGPGLVAHRPAPRPAPGPRLPLHRVRASSHAGPVPPPAPGRASCRTSGQARGRARLLARRQADLYRQIRLAAPPGPLVTYCVCRMRTVISWRNSRGERSAGGCAYVALAWVSSCCDGARGGHVLLSRPRRGLGLAFSGTSAPHRGLGPPSGSASVAPGGRPARSRAVQPGCVRGARPHPRRPSPDRVP
jgi:hypothetical protein